MRPFILDSYKIRGKEVLAKTNEGKVYSFKIYPKEKTASENYYTKFIPERKEYGIFSADFNRIKQEDIDKVFEVKLVHELTHYDARVISPVYSTGRLLPISDEMKKMGFDLLFLDNLIEDLQSQTILREFFEEKDIAEAVRFKEGVISRAYFIIDVLKTCALQCGLNLGPDYINTLEKHSKIFDMLKIPEGLPIKKRLLFTSLFYFMVDGILAYGLTPDMWSDGSKKVDCLANEKFEELFTPGVLRRL